MVSGPGGVGKGTVLERVRSRDPRLWLSRSWTTRPRRPGEDEDSYVFVDRATFLRHLERDGFLEHNELSTNGQLYGTPIPDPPADRDVLLEIEVNGARQVKVRFPDARMILMVAPSAEVQADRLRARGDDAESVTSRVVLGAEEEAVGRAMADDVVVNDDVERAAAEVAGILARYRSEE